MCVCVCVLSGTLSELPAENPEVQVVHIFVFVFNAANTKEKNKIENFKIYSYNV